MTINYYFNLNREKWIESIPEDGIGTVYPQRHTKENYDEQFLSFSLYIFSSLLYYLSFY